MTRKQVVDIDGLLATNPEYLEALLRGDKWALDHMRTCESLNAGEPEGFRRPFDGNPRKWCGGACPFPEGCVMCTLPEDSEMAKFNRQIKRDPMTLAQEGVITISGEVTWEMARQISKMLAIAEANHTKELEVRIQSNGGDVWAGLHIYDMIRDVPVHRRVGVVREYALSMAAIILQACDERIAAPSARFLMHHTGFEERITIETLKNPDRVRQLIARCEPDEERMNGIAMSRTKRSLDEIKKLCDEDKIITSDEALKFGLIDSVRDFTD